MTFSTEFSDTLFLAPCSWGTGIVCFKVIRYVGSNNYSVVIQIIAPKSKRNYRNIINTKMKLKPGQTIVSVPGVRRCVVITSVHDFVKNRLKI